MAKKWWEVCIGQDEKRVFVGRDGNSGLARGHAQDGRRYVWRTVSAIVGESGLKRTEVEAILSRHLPSGLVVRSDDGDMYAYRDNAPATEDKPDVVREDQKKRAWR